MAHRAPGRRSPAARRVGYAAAIIALGALLYLINAQPGWEVVPFLTQETTQVLVVVNVALAVGIATNLVYLGYDPPWLRATGDIVSSAVGLVAAVRILQVFPFAFHGSAAGWLTVIRVILIVAIVGSAIAIIVNAVALAGHARRGRRSRRAGSGGMR